MTRATRACVRVGLAMVLAGHATTPHAHAGDVTVADVGASAIGRGAAFVAKADNLAAFHYNPAGLACNDDCAAGTSVLAGVTAIRLDLQFSRRGSGGLALVRGRYVQDPAIDPDTGEPFARVSPSLSGGLSPAPILVARWHAAFGVPHLAVALGSLCPSLVVGRGLPVQGPQRYAAGQLSGVLVYAGVAAAYRVSSSLRIGAAIMNAVSRFRIALPVRPLAQPHNDVERNENRYEDHTFIMRVSDYFTPTAGFGVLARPFDWLELGVSTRLAVDVQGHGPLDYRPPQNPAFRRSFLACSSTVAAEPCAGEGRVALRQRFPWVVRSGARYIGTRFDVEMDLIWENWRKADVVSIEPDAALVLVDDAGSRPPQPLPDVHLNRRLRDTWSFRAGSDVAIIPELATVRLGAFYSTSAYGAKTETFNIDAPFRSQFGFAGGITWRAGTAWALSVAYMHVWQPRTSVRDGTIQQHTATEPNLGNVVNNGVYDVGLDLVSLSAQANM